jgi:uncharacterized membrane protein YphA (DoxX/SURF4 family)
MNSFKKLSRFDIGLLILRLGIAAVFLWFGFSQLFDSLAWVAIVPDWAVNILNIPPAMIVLGNGVIEVVLGSLLALGFWVRIVSFILALHLIPITLDMGFTAIGVRDFGLTLASFALSFLYDSKEKTNQTVEIK